MSVTRSILETLLPSSRSERIISAFSIGRYMPSRGFSCGSRNVLEHWRYFAKLGRKGGLKGGNARAKKLTPEQRSESARKAVQARWAKKKAGKADVQ
jgi:hypothetical protein